ncbi:hypothetical protein CBM2623_B170042 [Cupriavidus taiwanensis]|nr:hypothetical protein CBM2608_B140114 [Cupriavidus taiwanensis]SPA32825.1 hypothetical protein CBM2623_B170042 [Cupriavidus taiwanensis]
MNIVLYIANLRMNRHLAEQMFAELRLPSRPLQVDHEISRHRQRDIATQILLHHGQDQIEDGGHAGRCPDVRITNEYGVGIHEYFGIPLAHEFSHTPVRGSTPAPEQAGLSKKKAS